MSEPIDDIWKTLKSTAEIETKVKGSRFIGRGWPVESLEEIEEHLHRIRKLEYNATHNTFAWRIGFGDDLRMRASDDGEPSGTAGRPILQVLELEEVTGALVIVTRYFGGTKLGTGGLARAYGGAAKEALESAGVVVCYHKDRVGLELDFNQYNIWMRILADHGLQPGETEFTTSVSMQMEIRKSLTETLHAEYVELTRGQGRWEIL